MVKSLHNQKHAHLILAWVFVLVALFSTGNVWAGTATAELNRTTGTLDDQFQLTVIINGGFDGEVPQFEIPGCEVFSTGSNRSVQWINGKYSSELQLTYIIAPQQLGKFTVPSLKLKVDKEEIATLPIPFEVRGDGAAPHAGSGSGSSPAAPNQQSGQSSPTVPPGEKSEVFIEREVVNPSPYVGEAVMTIVRIYHRVRLTGGTPAKPSAPDFRFVPVPGERNFQQIINGQRFAVIELREVIVPLRAGDLVLPPYVLNASLVVPVGPRQRVPGSIWDMLQGGMFGMTKEVQKKITGKETLLKVKKLPTDGRPPTFSGVVGEFQLRADLSQKSVALGDTVTITTKIAGTGVLDDLGDVRIPVDGIGKVYPDKPQTNVQFDDRAIQSAREMKHALVPTKAGTFALGNLQVVVFNPAKAVYETLSADLGSLEVTGDAAVSANGHNVVAPPIEQPQAVRAIGDDLIAQHADDLLVGSHTLGHRGLFILLVFALAPWTVAGGLWAWNGWSQTGEGAQGRKRRANALKAFMAQLQAIDLQRAAPQSLDAAAVAERLQSAWRQFLSDRCGLDSVTARAMTNHEISAKISEALTGEALRNRALVVEKLAQVATHLKHLEALQYGSPQHAEKPLKEAIEALRNAAQGLEAIT